jgi:autotransporter-associated beta strand protein
MPWRCKALGTALLLALCLSNSAHAGTYYWDGNGTTAGAGAAPSGTWNASSGSLWNSDSTGGAGGSFGAVPTSTDTAVFIAGPGTGSGDGTYTVGLGGGTVSVTELEYDGTGNMTLGSATSDGTLMLGTGGLSASGSGGGAKLTLNSDVVLNGNQIWTSSNGGNPTSLQVNGTLSGTGNLTVSIGSSRATNFSGFVDNVGSLTVNSTFAGAVNFTGGIGSNVTNFSDSGATGVVLLSGTNTYTGTTTITGPNSGTSTLRVGSNTALPTMTVVVLNAQTKNATAKLDLGNGTSSYNETVSGLADGGTTRAGFESITNSDSTSGFAHTATLTVTPSGSDSFYGQIQDGSTSRVGVAMAGAGNLILNSNNAYTGGTTISSGTMTVNSNSGATLSNVSMTTFAASGSTLGGAGVSSNAGMAIGQNVTIGGTAYTIAGLSGSTIIYFSSSPSAGTVTGSFSSYQSIGSGFVTVSGTGVLDLSASTATSVGAVTLSGGTIQNGTLAGTSYATSSGAVTANLTGTGALTQNGSGATTLWGNNTFTGGTSVLGGTLVISNSAGSATGSGAVSVNSGATLSGTGTVNSTNNTINGNVLVGNGGTTDVLTMTASGTTNFGGSHLTFNLGTGGGGTTLGNSSQLALVSTPNVVFDGTNGLTLTFNLVGGTAVAAGTQYVLFSSTDGSSSPFTFTGNISLSGSNVISGSGLTLAINSSQGAGYYNGSYLQLVSLGGSGYDIDLDVQVQTVPEPSTYAMLLGGLALLIVFQRSRRRDS